MGRPSKLSDQQRADVRKRLLAGEKPSAIAADLGVHKSQISRCGVAPLKKEREIATQLVNAEVALRELPLIQQLNVLQLADEYRSTVVSMATAGKLGAMTAARLSSMAHSIVSHIERDEHGRPKETAMEPLRTAAALTQLAERAASIPLSVLSAQKIHVARAVENPEPKDMGEVKELTEQDAAQAYQDLMRGD